MRPLLPGTASTPHPSPPIDHPRSRQSPHPEVVVGHNGRVDRRALATFLRTRRERLTPAQVGLPSDGTRRTPRLRREEVAHLACISLEHYVHLKQARGAAASRAMLTALAGALRLDHDEHEHLLALAGHAAHPAPSPPRQVPRSVMDLLGRVPGTAALVLAADYDVLAWNALAAALLEDYSAVPSAERNLVRRHFLPPRTCAGTTA